VVLPIFDVFDDVGRTDVSILDFQFTPLK